MASAGGCWPRARGIAVGDAPGCLVLGPRLNNREQQAVLRFQVLVRVLAEARRDGAALRVLPMSCPWKTGNWGGFGVLRLGGTRTKQENS